MPPRIFPMARSRLCCKAALTVMAISGRFVTIASKIKPPNASPRPKCVARISAVWDNLIPANQIATALTQNMSTRTVRESDSIIKKYCNARLPYHHSHQIICLASFNTICGLSLYNSIFP